MPTYETLDQIADAYIPLLAIISFGLILYPLFRARWRLCGLRLFTLFMLLFVAYGLMFLDRQFQIWPRFNLDYSTHTAVALVLVAFLAGNAPRFTLPLIASFVAYLILMLYQGYHPVSDIVVTGLAVAMPTGLILACFRNCCYSNKR